MGRGLGHPLQAPPGARVHPSGRLEAALGLEAADRVAGRCVVLPRWCSSGSHARLVEPGTAARAPARRGRRGPGVLRFSVMVEAGSSYLAGCSAGPGRRLSRRRFEGPVEGLVVGSAGVRAVPCSFADASGRPSSRAPRSRRQYAAAVSRPIHPAWFSSRCAEPSSSSSSRRFPVVEGDARPRFWLRRRGHRRPVAC